MAISDFVVKTFQNKDVDVYCGSSDWFYGTVKECLNGVLTLVAPEGEVHVNVERILSVSPRLSA